VEQGLHLLITTSMAKRHHAQLRFLVNARMAPQTDGGAEGSAVTVGKQGLDTTPEAPSSSCDHPQLQSDRLFPTCRMTAGRSPHPAQRRPSVVTGWSPSIRAGKIKDAIQGHSLESERQKSMGGPKSVNIHHVKPLSPQQAIRKQPVGRLMRQANETVALKDSQIGLQDRKPGAITIIRPQTGSLGFQSIAQGTETTARHQIQDTDRSVSLQGSCQQNPQIPGRPGGWIEKALASLKQCGPLTLGDAFRFHPHAKSHVVLPMLREHLPVVFG
jgi:hypothetical protein